MATMTGVHVNKRIGAAFVAALATGGIMAPSAAATRGTVCTGVSGCKVVSRADVDGDGRADQVGVTTRVASSGERSTVVRVRTARGLTLKTTTKGVWYSNPWHGAAKIDGQPGYELVIGANAGAHAQFFRVITYRSGQLVTLKGPGNSYTWLIDSSYSFNSGWYRKTSSGRVQMTSKGAVRNVDSAGHDLRINTYQWRSGSWSRVSSSRNRHASDRAAMTIGGWHVPYLKVYGRG